MVKKNEDCDKQETKIKEYFFKQSLPDYLKWLDFLPDFIPFIMRPAIYAGIIIPIFYILYVKIFKK
jgi:hypothetical protein